MNTCRAALPAVAAMLLMAAARGQSADPLSALLEESRPLSTRWQTDYQGILRLGVGYTNEDNHQFGEYSGLARGGSTLIGDLQWNDFSGGDSYWDISFSDLGQDTREGYITWGYRDQLEVTLNVDSRIQVRNDTGLTPFRGETDLRLPQGWVSGLTTRDWSMLEEALQGFERELRRDRYGVAISVRPDPHWTLTSSLQIEHKQGTAETGAAIYVDASAADAVLLPAPVDHQNTDLELGVEYSGTRLHIDGHLAWAEFNNRDALLRWQNPYSNEDPRVAWPMGSGAVALEPDNERLHARLSGNWTLSPSIRLQFDASRALTSQDQDFADYSANAGLEVREPIPLQSLDANLTATTVNTRALLLPATGLRVEAWVNLRERNYDVPRRGFRYIRGDGGDQPRQSLTVYNTAHDYLARTAGVEISWRTPLRGRLSASYEYEEVERENAAVEKTGEDRVRLHYRVRPTPTLQAALAVTGADRGAGTYHWDQSYYALLDTALINATPASQRYLNHPALSQFHLANREQLEVKVDLNYTPSPRWHINLTALWRDEDFDASMLGLTTSAQQRLHLDVGLTLTESLILSAYAGVDRLKTKQRGRAFRGGQEKNAFDATPPLPQASDPDRDWNLETADHSTTLGASLEWQWRQVLSFQAEYSFVDTSSQQTFAPVAARDLDPDDLPDADTRMHRASATGQWHLREHLTLELDYRYYRFESNDWSWRGVAPDTLRKVLTFGQSNPRERIHYMGASVIYRWH